jgi:hypothetical protein
MLLALTVLALILWELIANRQGHEKLKPDQPRLTPHASRLTIHNSQFPHLLLAACACLLIILPFALPYFQVQRDLGFERTLADNEPFSASLRQYVMVPSGGVVHGRWLPSDETPIAGGYPVDALFPGLVTLALAAWGLIRGQGRTRWFFLVLLLAAFILSLGPRLYLAPGEPAGLDAALPYAWLYTLVPGFKALRAPARFDALVMLSLAVLAGYGVARFKLQVAEKKPSHLLLATCLLLFVTLEALVWPAANAEPVPVGDQVPPVYRWLAEQDPVPILELPMAFTPDGPKLDYQYASTYHWQTTPDGYSGFIPPKHGQIVYEMERFPSERSVSLLQALDVGYVVVHRNRYPAADWHEMQAGLAQSGELALVETFETDHVYQVQPRNFDPGALTVYAYLPPRAVAGETYTAYVIAIDDGSRSYAVQPTDVIRPSIRWDTAEEDTIQVTGDVPLVTSPHGGAAVIPLPLAAPAAPGQYNLSASEKDGPLGAWSSAGTVEVGDQGHSAFPVPARLEAWDLPPTARPGKTLTVRLTWRALGKIDAYYSVYVKLIDAGGSAIAAWDGQPRSGEAPTLLWVPGGIIDDSITLAVPADALAGDYAVEVGMYRAEDLARCLTLNQEGLPVGQVALGPVHIEP